MLSRTLSSTQQAQLDGFIVTDYTTGSTLFGKARFSPNPLITPISIFNSNRIEFKEIDHRNHSAFNSVIIVDLTTGTFTFLQTKFFGKTKEPEENQVSKIRELIGFLSKFNVLYEIGPYFVVSCDITENMSPSINFRETMRSGLSADNVDLRKSKYHYDMFQNYILDMASGFDQQCTDPNTYLLHYLQPDPRSDVVFLRYLNHGLSTTIQGLNENESHRFIVNENDVLCLKNKLAMHSIPYFQSSTSISREEGNLILESNKMGIRSLLRTQVFAISKEKYDAIITNIGPAISRQFSGVPVSDLILHPISLKIPITEYNSQRQHYEAGGKKIANRKGSNRKSKNRTKTILKNRPKLAKYTRKHSRKI
jgi:hypothetical protein